MVKLTGVQLSLCRRYKQEKEFSKNMPIFNDEAEKREYIKKEITRESDELKKELLNKQLFI